MRRLAFEVISQSETKSAQSRKRRERERNNAYFNGHFVALAHALRLDQKNKRKNSMEIRNFGFSFLSNYEQSEGSPDIIKIGENFFD